MKVEQNTDQRLVIVHRPWALAGLVAFMALATLWAALTDEEVSTVTLIFICALALAMLFGAWYFFPFTRTVFDRTSRTVTHVEDRLFRTRYKAIALSDLRGAQVEAQWSDNARLTRLTLVLQRDHFPLEKGFGPGDRRRLEAAINEWLTRP